jgi:alpha/beta superfamily hydrolase
MPRRIETFFVNGPVGRLESMIEEPEWDQVAAALVLHPHPQHGGTMHNKVVHRMARGLRSSGSAVMRLNYRGVNLSEGTYAGGIGETEDARAALDELRFRYRGLPVILAGFSFGSRIALRIARDEPGIDRVLAAGFPTIYPDHEYVSEVRIPKYFIQSTSDAFGPADDLQALFDTLAPPKELTWVQASDHFFAGNLDELERVAAAAGKLN